MISGFNILKIKKMCSEKNILKWFFIFHISYSGNTFLLTESYFEITQNYSWYFKKCKGAGREM